jgi:DNA-binding CsgD family transcriptional regulator
MFDLLTDRQADVLRLMCTGMNDRQIAERLGISMRTARQHRYQIKHRLQNETCTEICRMHEAQVKRRLEALRERIWRQCWHLVTPSYPGHDM